MDAELARLTERPHCARDSDELYDDLRLLSQIHEVEMLRRLGEGELRAKVMTGEKSLLEALNDSWELVKQNGYDRYIVKKGP